MLTKEPKGKLAGGHREKLFHLKKGEVRTRAILLMKLWPKGQRGAIILMVRQQAWLQTTWQALPHWLLPTQGDHTLWCLRQHPLQASLAEKAVYLNHALFGDSHGGGGMLKTEENRWRLRDPQN